MGGVVGLDMGAVLATARAMGLDEAVMAILVPYGQGGLVRALNKRTNDDGES